MSTKVCRRDLWHWLLAVSIASLLTACAFNRDVVFHSFAFNMLRDEQDAEVLDYLYGDSKMAVRAQVEEVREGKTFGGYSVMGRIPKGDFLYVKWRNKSTGHIYEDTVDLRRLLPHAIEKHILYFMIRGAQLYVFLISPDPKPPEASVIGPDMYASRKVTQLYPAAQKQ